jgi:hypothetical protein
MPHAARQLENHYSWQHGAPQYHYATAITKFSRNFAIRKISGISSMVSSA